MDYTQFVNELKNSHSDTIEILSDKLVAWLTTAGATTFNLSSGDFTIQNLPNIEAGNFTVKAGANISVNAPVKLYDDGGTVKAKELAESEIIESTALGLSDSEGYFYSSTYGTFLHIVHDATDVTGKIGTIATDGTITYGASFPIYSGTVLGNISLTRNSVRITSMGANDFVISILDDGNIILIGGTFSNANTVVLGAEFDTTKTLVVDYTIASNGSDTLHLLFETSTSNELFSELYDYTQLTNSLVMIVGSDLTMSASTIVSATFKNCYDNNNDMFHSIYSNIDATYEYIYHASVNVTTGAIQTSGSELTKNVRDKIHRCPSNLFYNDVNKTLVMLSTTTNLETLPGKVTMEIINISIQSDDVQIINIDKILDPFSGDALNDVLFSSSLFDSDRNMIIMNYTGLNIANMDKSFFVEIDLSTNPSILRRFELYRYEDGVSTWCGYDILKTDKYYIFKPYGEEKIFTCNFEERSFLAGVAIEAKLSGEDVTVALKSQFANSFVGLVVGKTYYLQKDMTVSTTKNEYPLGIAVSSTKLKLF
jgi:hypothetical protein